MEKIKSFTSLEQSRKLAEILPIESADMFWRHCNLDGLDYPIMQTSFEYIRNANIPCWSLSALLGVLPKIQGGKPIIALDDNYITYPHISDLHTKADKLVDACVYMIIKLHEENLL